MNKILFYFILLVLNSSYALANNKIYYKGQIGISTTNFKIKSDEAFYRDSKNHIIRIPLIYQFGVGYYIAVSFRQACVAIKKQDIMGFRYNKNL